MSLRSRPLLLLVLLSAVGCTDSIGEKPILAEQQFAEHDSAGVSIAENGHDASVWRISAEDAGEGIGSRELLLVNVAGATRFHDGVAIADNGSRAVFLVSETGTEIFGGEWEGPGEFQSLHGLWFLDTGSLATFDRALQRLTIFTPDGRLQKIVPMRPAAANPPIPVGVLETNLGVVRETPFELPNGGFAEQRALIKIFDGDTVRIVANLRSARYYRSEPGAPIVVPLFEAGAVAAAAGDFIAVSECRRPELRIVNATGRLHAVVRWNPGDLGVGTDDIEAHARRELVGLSASERRRLEERLEDTPTASSFPACDRIMAEPSGTLYVRDYQRPMQSHQVWRKFVEGRQVAILNIPADLEVLSFGDRSFLALERDELDVESVKGYRLRPREASAR